MGRAKRRRWRTIGSLPGPGGRPQTEQGEGRHVCAPPRRRGARREGGGPRCTPGAVVPSLRALPGPRHGLPTNLLTSRFSSSSLLRARSLSANPSARSGSAAALPPPQTPRTARERPAAHRRHLPPPLAAAIFLSPSPLFLSWPMAAARGRCFSPPDQWGGGRAAERQPRRPMAAAPRAGPPGGLNGGDGWRPVTVAAAGREQQSSVRYRRGTYEP